MEGDLWLRATQSQGIVERNNWVNSEAWRVSGSPAQATWLKLVPDSRFESMIVSSQVKTSGQASWKKVLDLDPCFHNKRL